MLKANQLGIVERHVEKGVVALCFIFLLYAVFHWALGSPRSIEVKQGFRAQEVSPLTVDDALLSETARTLTRIDNAEPRPMEVPDYLESLEGHQQALDATARLAVLSSPHRPLPVIEEPNLAKPTFAVAQFREAMPAPLAPQVWAGRELVRKAQPEDVVAAHAAVVYPYAELADTWGNLTDQTQLPLKIVFYGVDVEIRRLAPNGDVLETRTAELVPPINPEDGEPIDVPEIGDWRAGQDPAPIRETVDILADPRWQATIMEPGYWQILTPARDWGAWRVHLPETPLSRLRETPPGPEPAREAPRPRATPRPGVGDEFEGAFTEEMRRREEEMVRGARDADAAPRRTRSVSAPPGAPRGSGDESAPAVPDWSDQLRGGRVLLWFHDTSLEAATIYQYRVRVKIVNPLLARDEYAATPEDARQKTLASSWSPWSESFSVAPATEFFITGSSEAMGTVRITVFTRSLGQVVRRNFTVGRGWSIGDRARVVVSNPVTKERLRKTVDFSAGAVVVDLDFDKTVRIGAFPRSTIEMLYLDREGKLQTRTQAEDQESDRYERLLEDVEAAEAALEP